MSLRDLVTFAQNEISHFDAYVDTPPPFPDGEEAEVHSAIDLPPPPSPPGFGHVPQCRPPRPRWRQIAFVSRVELR